MTTPNPEEALRNLLRHLRRANHELLVASDVGGYFGHDIKAVSGDVGQIIQRVEVELARVRRSD
jgi:hypothetical protein